MKFELKPYNRNVTDKELLDDLKSVIEELNLDSITREDFDKSNKGRFYSGTIAKRFNGWDNALNKLGFKAKVRKNIPEKELIQNLQTVWIKLGHQPVKRDMINPYSNFSEVPYINLYGSWRKALEIFVEYINSRNEQIQEIEDLELDNKKSKLESSTVNKSKHLTKRDISDRLKVKVLIRDGNKCRLCGVEVTGDNIHFDHIKPWSKGGETTLENIQVLCSSHNLAKGDYDNE